MGKKSGQRVTVLVSDSSRMGSQLLGNALKLSRYGLKVTDQVTTSAEILSAIDACEPQVALISATLQDGVQRGLKILREIHTCHPDVALVALLEACEREHVVEAFRAGATGIFSRVKSPEELSKCIYAVHHGQIWASSEELKFLLQAFQSAVQMHPSDANGNRLLTRREEQVVSLVAEGMSNREISSHLRLSEHTVKNYIFRIFNKLGISSRVELLLYALNHNGSSGSIFNVEPGKAPSKSQAAA
jgi:two-component system nitrate/nitrite response regulator NarL